MANRKNQSEKGQAEAAAEQAELEWSINVWPLCD